MNPARTLMAALAGFGSILSSGDIYATPIRRAHPETTRAVIEAAEAKRERKLARNRKASA